MDNEKIDSILTVSLGTLGSGNFITSDKSTDAISSKLGNLSVFDLFAELFHFLVYQRHQNLLQ